MDRYYFILVCIVVAFTIGSSQSDTIFFEIEETKAHKTYGSASAEVKTLSRRSIKGFSLLFHKKNRNCEISLNNNFSNIRPRLTEISADTLEVNWYIASIDEQLDLVEGSNLFYFILKNGSGGNLFSDHLSFIEGHYFADIPLQSYPAQMSINYDLLDNTLPLKVMPNPLWSNAEVSITLATEGTYCLQIYNRIGQFIDQISIYLPSGNNLVYLGDMINKLDKGMYILELHDTEKKVSQARFIKL